MKALITGGAGFIGSHICDAYIKAGYETHIVDDLSTGFEHNINPKAIFHKMNINSDEVRELILREKFDFISHHAAQMNVRVSVADPRFDATTNILGSLNIFEAAKDAGVKKIAFASSGGTIYGEQDYFPADEVHICRPCSPYGIAKFSVEKYLFYYKEVYGIDYVAFRYGNVYGPRQNPHGEAGVIAIFIDKMLNKQQAVINGDGLITRDYVFIDDVVKANLFAIQSDISGSFNITTGVETDVNTIFNKLKSALNSDCEECHGPAKAGEQRRSVCSPEKIFKATDWKPEMNFNDGIKTTVEYAVKEFNSKC
jgi:UDP-glucose 4-epimerase